MSVMINTNKHTPAFSAALHVSPVAVALGHSQVAFGDRAALRTNTGTSALTQGAVWGELVQCRLLQCTWVKFGAIR